MSKIIRIKSCKECPKMYCLTSDSKFCAYNELNSPNEIIDDSIIPSFCFLENSKDSK